MIYNNASITVVNQTILEVTETPFGNTTFRQQFKNRFTDVVVCFYLRDTKKFK